MTNELETAADRSDRMRTTPSQDRVRVELQNQTSYGSTIDKYINASQSSRPDLVQLPEYTLQQFAESGHGRSGGCVPRVERIRHIGLPAADAHGVPVSRASSGACRSTSANPVLYYNRKIFEAAGPRPRRPAVDVWTSCARPRSRSSTPVLPPTDSCSTAARIREAAGSSSSGSVGPARRTRTTATVASPRRPRCCSTAPPVSS